MTLHRRIVKSMSSLGGAAGRRRIVVARGRRAAGAVGPLAGDGQGRWPDEYTRTTSDDQRAYGGCGRSQDRYERIAARAARGGTQTPEVDDGQPVRRAAGRYYFLSAALSGGPQAWRRDPALPRAIDFFGFSWGRMDGACSHRIRLPDPKCRRAQRPGGTDQPRDVFTRPIPQTDWNRRCPPVPVDSNGFARSC